MKKMMKVKDIPKDTRTTYGYTIVDEGIVFGRDGLFIAGMAPGEVARSIVYDDGEKNVRIWPGEDHEIEVFTEA